MQLLKQYVLKIKVANQLSQEASNSDLAKETEKNPTPNVTIIWHHTATALHNKGNKASTNQRKSWWNLGKDIACSQSIMQK